MLDVLSIRIFSVTTGLCYCFRYFHGRMIFKGQPLSGSHYNFYLLFGKRGQPRAWSARSIGGLIRQNVICTCLHYFSSVVVCHGGVSSAVCRRDVVGFLDQPLLGPTAVCLLPGSVVDRCSQAFRGVCCSVVARPFVQGHGFLEVHVGALLLVFLIWSIRDVAGG